MLLEELEAKNGGKKQAAKACCHTDHLGATEYTASPFMPFGIAALPGLESYDDRDDYYRHVGADISNPRDVAGVPIITRTVNALVSRRSEK